jgi:hypothetical protein
MLQNSNTQCGWKIKVWAILVTHSHFGLLTNQYVRLHLGSLCKNTLGLGKGIYVNRMQSSNCQWTLGVLCFRLSLKQDLYNVGYHVGGSHGKAEKPISFNVLELIVWARLISWVSLQLLLIQRFGKRFWCFCKISTKPSSVPNSNVSKKHFSESLIHVLQ